MSKHTSVAHWTKTPGAVIEHLEGLPRSERYSLLSLYERMSRGEDGGQIEAWSFHSVRSAVYSHWSDDDFKVVVESFCPIRPPTRLD